MSGSIQSGRRQPHRYAAGALLRRPVVWTSLMLWAFNDHLLKARCGGWLTGKLSDVTGLIVLPVALYSAYELSWALLRRPPARLEWAHWSALLITASLLISVNSTPALERWVSEQVTLLLSPLWSVLSARLSSSGSAPLSLRSTVDHTDLLTLPALWIPHHLISAHLGELKRRDTHACSSEVS